MNRKTKNIIQIDEKELLEKAQLGDFNAFSELIKAYQPKILGLALKISKNREDAEDIFQETFLKAIDNLEKFRGESSFGTWLYTIMVNIMRAKYKKEQKAELMPLEDYLPHKHNAHDPEAASLLDWRDPLSKMTDREIKSKIDEAIQTLPFKYRLPFLLRYTQDMSMNEVADTLKLSLPAAKSRVLRARVAMRQQLDDYFSEGYENV